MKIDRPGVYEISAEDYHADPCAVPSLSSSIARLLVNRTPKHAWTAHPRLNLNFEPQHKEAFDVGNAAHSLMLNDPKSFEVVDAPDWRSKEARAKRDGARAAGKIPLLLEQWDRVQLMIVAARAQLDAHTEARDAFTNGRAEVTLVWNEGPAWLRSRPDWTPNSGAIFDDYKTTDCADPDAFVRSVIEYGYDIQCALYTRGLRALGICERPQFRFVAQETKAPFALSVIGLAPGFLDLAERKVEKAISLWTDCLRTNVWPAYPDRTCWIECPDWHESAYLNREVREHDADKLQRAREAQAPL